MLTKFYLTAPGNADEYVRALAQFVVPVIGSGLTAPDAILTTIDLLASAI